jgi:hypothetical protein
LRAAGAKNVPHQRGAYPIDIARAASSNTAQAVIALLSPFETTFDAIGQNVVASGLNTVLPSDAEIAFVKSPVTSGCTRIPVGAKRDIFRMAR